MAAAAIAFVTASARLAGADESSTEVEPIRIRYAPPPECPQETTLARQVLARTQRARAARDDERARTFEATVKVSGPRVEGQLVVREADGQASTRVVTGKACAEVEAALALVAALIVDPRASTKPVASLVLPPAPPLSPPPPPPPPQPPPPPPPSTPPPRVPAILPPTEKPWRFEGGARALARTGIASQPAWGESVFLGTASSSTALTALALRISATIAGAADVSTPNGGARFRWLLARAEACPLLVAPGPTFLARACLLAEGGALLADGVDTPDAQSRTRPWVAPGLGARAEWLIAPPLALELELDGLAPLLRDSFSFGPAGAPPVAVLPQVPAVIGSASFGVAVRAP